MRSHPGIATILIAFLALAVAYGWTIPTFESPDASGHYAYIHELTEGRGLPVQGEPSGERVTGYVTSHPPLYYLLSAALSFWVPDDTDFWGVVWVNPYHANGYPGSVANKNLVIHQDEGFPWHGTALTVHIARLVSTVLGTGAVLATYLIALELFPDRRWLALGAASLAAFNPMFVFTSARVSNDAAVACFGGLALWGAVRLAARGLSRRGLALTGTAWGLAILSKFSGTTLGPALALALLIDGVRDAEPGMRDMLSALRRSPVVFSLLRHAIILFGAAALVCGWWFLRNQLLYDDLMGVDAWLSHTETVRPEPIGLFDVIHQLEGLEISYWAIFGWFNVAVAEWMYDVLWWLVRLALLGLVIIVVERLVIRAAYNVLRITCCVSRITNHASRITNHESRITNHASLTTNHESRTTNHEPRTTNHEPRTTNHEYGLLTLFTGFIFVFGSVWRFIMIVLGSQGRYLVPVLVAISFFLMWGLSRLVPRRWEPGLALALALGLFLFALVSLTGYILPAYAQPTPVAEADLPSDLTRFDVWLGDSPIRLIGGRVHQAGARPSDTVTVDVYWQATAPVEGDYVAYVKLLGRGGTPIGSFDGYPGGGTFPTSLWQPGQIYRDRYRLPVDAGAKAPTLVSLNAGLRDRGGSLPPTLDSGEPWPGGLVLDQFPLRPRQEPKVDLAYRLDVRLQSPDGAEQISLIGADAHPAQVRSGEALTLTLVWQAESPIRTPYTVFAHLRDGNDQLVAQADGPPRAGDYPTTFWAQGEKVIDTRVFHLPPDVQPGSYRLVVGLYQLETGTRLALPDGTSEIDMPFEATVR